HLYLMILRYLLGSLKYSLVNSSYNPPYCQFTICPSFILVVLDNISSWRVIVILYLSIPSNFIIWFLSPSATTAYSSFFPSSFIGLNLIIPLISFTYTPSIPSLLVIALAGNLIPSWLFLIKSALTYRLL